MAMNNAEMAEAWGALLGLTPEKVTELTGLLDQWALGGARLATWSRLATDVNLFNNAAVAMMFDWYGGAADGGPNGDGLYPLMNSEGEVLLVASPAKIVAGVSGLDPKGVLASEADLPATGAAGDLWVIDGDAWGWSGRDNRFNNLGPLQGASALMVMVEGGVLPPEATAEDFGTWLANSQSAAIQPLVDAAGASATAAAESATDAGAAAGAASDAAGAAGQAATDAGLAAGAAGEKAGEAAGSAGTAATLRNEAQQFRNEAEQFRNEAGEIAGGDFLTEVQANALYRKLADALGIADVTGLAAALNSKATPADITAAINALVDGAPAALDTLKELAEALADSDDALAALVLAMGDKADKASTYTKTQVDALTTRATVAQVRAGKASGVVIEPDEAAGAMAFKALVDAATVAVDLDTGPNFTLLTTAGVGVGRTIGKPTNGNPGQYYTLAIKAHAIGATTAWDTAFKWPNGKTEAIGSAAVGEVTEVAFKMIDANTFRIVGFVKGYAS